MNRDAAGLAISEGLRAQVGGLKVAARNGLGALAFSFVDPDEAKSWVDVYYDIIRSEECVPLGHTVNANIALVTGFSLDEEGQGAANLLATFDKLRPADLATVLHELSPKRRAEVAAQAAQAAC